MRPVELQNYGLSCFVATKAMFFLRRGSGMLLPYSGVFINTAAAEGFARKLVVFVEAVSG